MATRWVCFNDQAWESLWVGWVVWLTPTTYIQLAGAGAIDINKLGLSDATLNSSFRTTYKIKFPEPHPH